MHFVFALTIIFSGIPPHVDTHSAFEDTILSLSLGAKVRSQFLLYFYLYGCLCIGSFPP